MTTTSLHATMKEGALGLDMMPPLRPRRRAASEYRRERSKRIARKLMMSTSTTTTTTTTTTSTKHHNDNDNTQQEEKDPVVYRNLDGKDYLQCVFLDPYDILLAMNSDGDVDVVRIPASFDDNSTTQGDNNNNSNNNELMLGSALARGVRTNAVAPRCCKLQSIRRGEAFVVGMQDGMFKVYDTEHASSWCAKPSFQLQKSTLQQSTVHSNTTTSAAAAPQSSFLTALWTAYGPQRRYDRHESYSLLDQIRAPGDARSLELVEIRDWDTYQYLNHPGGRSSSSSSLNNKSQWDFRETASNCLMAVHVGAQQDFFGLRILDDRVSSGSGSSRNHVVIDEEMMNSLKGRDVEIQSTCFVSDWIVATLGPTYDADSKSYDNTHQSPTMNCVKLWDIRRMKKNQGPASQHDVVLPSFPRDTVHVETPSKSIGAPFNAMMFPLDDNYRLLLVASCIQFDTVYCFDVAMNEFTEAFSEANSTVHCFASTKGPGDMIANYNQERREITLYDVAARTCGFDVAGNNKGRKRPRDGEGYVPPVWAADNTSFQPKLQDRYGLSTELTDLSFSEHGNLAGCSCDGDLFVWRPADWL